MKDKVVDGFHNAPHRSLYHALGLTKEEQARPLIGIVSSYNEIVPGHMNLDKIADAVKRGVAMAGGTPIMFPAICVCDGIAMGHVGMKYSLVTRDLIADSTEAMVMAHGCDDPELRQKRARAFNGGGAAEHSDRVRLGRADAGGSRRRREAQLVEYV